MSLWGGSHARGPAHPASDDLTWRGGVDGCARVGARQAHPGALARHGRSGQDGGLSSLVPHRSRVPLISGFEPRSSGRGPPS
jgi:hypothetical protein